MTGPALLLHFCSNLVFLTIWPGPWALGYVILGANLRQSKKESYSLLSRKLLTLCVCYSCCLFGFLSDFYFILPSSPYSHVALLHNPRHDHMFPLVWFHSTFYTSSFQQLSHCMVRLGAQEICVEQMNEPDDSQSFICRCPCLTVASWVYGPHLFIFLSLI